MRQKKFSSFLSDLEYTIPAIGVVKAEFFSSNQNPIERLWKWMKEPEIYNNYYEDFEDFRSAVLGFFATLSTLDANSVFGQAFRSRVRDKFKLVGT